MKVKLSEIAQASLVRIAKDRARIDLGLALGSAIRLHLSQEDVEEKCIRLRNPPEWEAAGVYLFPMHEWAIIWSAHDADIIVWNVKDLRGYRRPTS